MATLDEWLARYGESHRDPTNRIIHRVCVPLISWSIIALLWCAPRPAAFTSLGVFGNWATVVAVVLLGHYLTLSLRAFVTMLLVFAAMFALTAALDAAGAPLLWLGAGVFVAAWIGQFVGHRIEGQKPSFLDDLRFLLIGPLWVLRRHGPR